MRSCYLALSAVFLFVGLSCTHKDVREPASAKQGRELISEKSHEALSQILKGDSPTQDYRRTMQIKFHTDGDEKYLSEQARKSLQQALVESLGGDTPEQGLAKVVAGELKDAVIENFIKTLRIYKIINLGLQADLYFLPEPNEKNSFLPEMSSNQLVHLQETSRLSEKWSRIESFSPTRTFLRNSYLVPKQGQADYLGGVVTLFVKIVDVNPKLKLPSLKKRGVQGFVRYRRYFRVADLNRSVRCDDFVMQVQPKDKTSAQFFTVDVYQNFNLANILPTDESIEIYPGIVAATNEGRADLLPNDSSAGTSINTGSFLISQNSNARGKINFTLSKIVYNLKDGNYDSVRSEAKVVAFENRGSTDYPADEYAALSAAKNRFINRCTSELERYLAISSLFKRGVR